MILQKRSGYLAILLFGAVALVASPAAAAAAAATTAAPKDVVPSCAPLENKVPAKPDSGSTAPAAKPAVASTKKKSKAQIAKEEKEEEEQDAKDFPPLKPGEHFHLIAFSISGSKHIDEDALIATLPQHTGDPFTQDEIKANTDKIKKALTEQHVHFADVTTSYMQREGADHCVGIVWDIQHIDAFSRLPYQGFWKFGGQTFSGNKALTNEQLEKAIDLKLDERVREGSMSDAVTGMQQAYAKVFPGQTVKIQGKLKLTPKPVRMANFEWNIVEPAANEPPAKK